MKDWDVNVPSHYTGYCSVNGSHIAMIIEALRSLSNQDKTHVFLDIMNDSKMRDAMTGLANAHGLKL